MKKLAPAVFSVNILLFPMGYYLINQQIKFVNTCSIVGKKTQWRWRCGYRDALIFAKLMWPHIQVKLHKIEQILDHYDTNNSIKPSADIIYLKERR